LIGRFQAADTGAQQPDRRVLVFPQPCFQQRPRLFENKLRTGSRHREAAAARRSAKVQIPYFDLDRARHQLLGAQSAGDRFNLSLQLRVKYAGVADVLVEGHLAAH